MCLGHGVMARQGGANGYASRLRTDHALVVRRELLKGGLADVHVQLRTEQRDNSRICRGQVQAQVWSVDCLETKYSSTHYVSAAPACI